LDINLIRDKDSGKSKGFAFLGYLDQRSTVLAVDNFNGIKLAGRTLRVDHVKDYKPPSKVDPDGNKIMDLSYNAMPQPVIESEPEEPVNVIDEHDDDTLMALNNIDPEDPMASFMLEKIKKSLKKEKKQSKKKKKAGDSKKKKILIINILDLTLQTQVLIKTIPNSFQILQGTLMTKFPVNLIPRSTLLVSITPITQDLHGSPPVSIPDDLEVDR